MKTKTKFLSKVFSMENIIRGIIVIGLVLFSSSKYEIMNILEGLGVVLGMALIGASIVRMYQEILDYLKTGIWGLSLFKTLIYFLVVVLISLLFVVFLSSKNLIWSFSSLGVIIFLLVIYNIVSRYVKKLF